MSGPKFLIWSREHTAWWRGNRIGYTNLIEDAGRYSFEDAFAICNQGNVVQNHSGKAPMETMVPAPNSPALADVPLAAPLSEADVCRIVARDAVYTIKRISAAPMRYVAYAATATENGPLHRDGVELWEAMAKIAACLQAQQLAAAGISP